MANVVFKQFVANAFAVVRVRDDCRFCRSSCLSRQRTMSACVLIHGTGGGRSWLAVNALRSRGVILTICIEILMLLTVVLLLLLLLLLGTRFPTAAVVLFGRGSVVQLFSMGDATDT